jgi:TPR repeat protein
MYILGDIHDMWKEHQQAMAWYTKGADAGLPKAMFNLGVCLEKAEGVAAPDYPAALDWYRRAADAGDERAANNLSSMFNAGRGWAEQMMIATSSSTL